MTLPMSWTAAGILDGGSVSVCGVECLVPFIIWISLIIKAVLLWMRAVRTKRLPYHLVYWTFAFVWCAGEYVGISMDVCRRCSVIFLKLTDRNRSTLYLPDAPECGEHHRQRRIGLGADQLVPDSGVGCAGERATEDLRALVHRVHRRRLGGGRCALDGHIGWNLICVSLRLETLS